MTIAVFGNTNKRATVPEVEHILHFMEERKVRVLLSQELRHEMTLFMQHDPFRPEDGEHVDFALSVGGDGTFLTTASVIGEQNIPILGINCGHLGFLADVNTNDIDNILQQLVDNNYTVEDRLVLQVTTINGGHIMHRFALNEVAVMKQELSSMIAVDTMVDGEYLHTYRADGLLIATPTGSTAYNLSVGGPIMSPHLQGVVLSPIATHSLNVRPLVVPPDRVFDLSVHSRSGSYLVSIDGRSQALKDDVTLHIERAPFTIKLVQLNGHSFINTLRDKLLWGAD